MRSIFCSSLTILLSYVRGDEGLLYGVKGWLAFVEEGEAPGNEVEDGYFIIWFIQNIIFDIGLSLWPYYPFHPSFLALRTRDTFTIGWSPEIRPIATFRHWSRSLCASSAKVEFQFAMCHPRIRSWNKCRCSIRSFFFSHPSMGRLRRTLWILVFIWFSRGLGD